MADIFKNEAVAVRTVRPEPRNVLVVQPGKVVTNVGARTVQYDEAPDFASPTNRTTGQSVTTTVVTYFRVTAGQGKVSISVAEKTDDATLDARLDVIEAPTSAYTTTNVTTDRSFDADTAVVTETNDVLGTLIADLQAKGILS